LKIAARKPQVRGALQFGGRVSEFWLRAGEPGSKRHTLRADRV